ncbi:hypothetical protein ACNT2N_26640 [Pseudomonas thivervalensis]|uniref:Uncharacterized protein n=1 Tax=Pseudomonas thivervalensis TaxID=86265 RepID=A0A2Z4ZWK0_9PSED|nr:hypothetical protein [Pseudomonas thivervalensis]AXA56691.1 hypothetical protein CE140_20735 [Pseudomonas thivervalensis]AXA62504.1 hypothetical protein CEQ51_21285 [Pseudomonas thivervalensis]
MALVVLDGMVEELGLASYVNGERMLSFVKINGRRIKNVSCDDYTRSFLKVGLKVRLALVRRIFGTHILYAIRLENGEVISRSRAWPIFLVCMFGLAIDLLMSPLFIMILKATHSILMSLISFILIGLGLAYVILKDHFKARLVFGKPSN